MKVKMLRNLSRSAGLENPFRNLPPMNEGQVYEVGEKLAQALLDAGLAEFDVPERQQQKPEGKAADGTAGKIDISGEQATQITSDLLKGGATPTRSPADAQALAEMTNYDDWSPKDLHAEADKRDIAGAKNMDKAALIKALKETDVAKATKPAGGPGSVTRK